MDYNYDQTLDQFLKERNRITDEQINELSRVHAIEGGGWAGHFVDAGIISENDLVKLIIESAKIPYLPIINAVISNDLIEEFTIDFLQTFECCPFERIGPLITIITPNPFQPELVRSRTNKIQKVELFVCRVGEWREVMKRIMDDIASKKKATAASKAKKKK